MRSLNLPTCLNNKEVNLFYHRPESIIRTIFLCLLLSGILPKVYRNDKIDQVKKYEIQASCEMHIPNLFLRWSSVSATLNGMICAGDEAN